MAVEPGYTYGGKEVFEELKSFIDLKREGYSARQIAELTGSNTATVNNAIRQKNIISKWNKMVEYFGGSDSFYSGDIIDISDYHVDRNKSKWFTRGDAWWDALSKREGPQWRDNFQESFDLVDQKRKSNLTDAINKRDFEAYRKARQAIFAHSKIIRKNAFAVEEAARVQGIDLENSALGRAHQQFRGGYSRNLQKRIIEFKSAELSPTRKTQSSGQYLDDANKWWDNLPDSQKQLEINRWARRDYIFYRNMDELLRLKNVTGLDAKNFLDSIPQLHHFDEVIGGSANLDKYFSAGYINQDLHKHLHNTGVSAKLNRRLNRAGIAGYNVLRKGDFPPWFTRTVNKFYGPEVGAKVLDDIRYMNLPSDVTPPATRHGAGNIFDDPARSGSLLESQRVAQDTGLRGGKPTIRGRIPGGVWGALATLPLWALSSMSSGGKAQAGGIGETVKRNVSNPNWWFSGFTGLPEDFWSGVAEEKEKFSGSSYKEDFARAAEQRRQLWEGILGMKPAFSKGTPGGASGWQQSLLDPNWRGDR